MFCQVKLFVQTIFVSFIHHCQLKEVPYIFSMFQVLLVSFQYVINTVYLNSLIMPLKRIYIYIYIDRYSEMFTPYQ